MTLDDIIQLASQHYPDGRVAAYWDSKRNKPRDKPEDGGGDLLAKFIVYELRDTYSEDGCASAQLNEASRSIERAIEELVAVHNALFKESERRKKRVAPRGSR